MARGDAELHLMPKQKCLLMEKCLSSVEIMTRFYLKLDSLVLQIYFNGELMALSATTVTVSASATLLNVCGNK